MATKSEWFRYLQERSGKDKPARVKRRRDRPVDTALPGVSASDRKAAGNFSLRAKRNAEYVLEESAAGRPSRKSTRKSANAMKPSHALRYAKQGQRARSARKSKARRRAK